MFYLAGYPYIYTGQVGFHSRPQFLHLNWMHLRNEYGVELTSSDERTSFFKPLSYINKSELDEPPPIKALPQSNFSLVHYLREREFGRVRQPLIPMTAMIEHELQSAYYPFKSHLLVGAPPTALQDHLFKLPRTFHLTRFGIDAMNTLPDIYGSNQELEDDHSVLATVGKSMLREIDEAVADIFSLRMVHPHFPGVGVVCDWMHGVVTLRYININNRSTTLSFPRSNLWNSVAESERYWMHHHFVTD